MLGCIGVGAEIAQKHREKPRGPARHRRTVWSVFCYATRMRV